MGVDPYEYLDGEHQSGEAPLNLMSLRVKMIGNDPAIELLVCLKTLRWFAFAGHMESPTNLLMITYSLVLKEASEISCCNQNLMRHFHLAYSLLTAKCRLLHFDDVHMA